MCQVPRRRPFAMLLIGGLIALGAGLSAIGQDRGPRQAATLPQPTTRATSAWRKAESCGVCHREITADDRKLLPRLQEIGDFVLFNEYATWAKDDVHSQAFLRLTSPRATEMAGKLGYDVQKDARCLSCHAPAAADAKHAGSIQAEGVTCVACHGAYSEWVVKHGEDFEGWVALDARQKWADYGMRDLRDPAVRSRLCVSCHVGSAAEGRVITHEMYVAGHPPLSGWESSAWARGMPAHWRPTRDVPYLRTANAAIRKNYRVADAEFEQTRHTLAGGVAVLAGMVELLQAHASARSAAKTPEAPEFARFDCRACHHDLRRDAGKPSWRQARGFAAAPGRPPLADWTLALIPAAIEAAARDAAETQSLQASFATALKGLDAALGAQPFGASDRTAKACGRLSEWLAGLSEQLDRAPVDRAKAIRILRGLADLAKAEPADFDTSRQVAWAFESIYHDLVPAGSEGAPARAVFDAWKAELRTELPHWRGPDPHASLAEFLNQAAEFDPHRFREQLAALAASIPSR